jgi:hypothetical protein
MMNRKNAGRAVITLDNDPLTEDTQEAVSSDVDMSMLNRSEENVDRDNIKPNQYADGHGEIGDGGGAVGRGGLIVDKLNGRGQKQQQSVVISIENRQKMKKFTKEYGSTQTWIINTALEYFFDARGV